MTSIVCIRVGNGALIYQPSVKRYCSKCGHEVWVAPSSIEVLAQGDARLVCMECAGISFEEPPPPGALVTRAALREVLDWQEKKGKT